MTVREAFTFFRGQTKVQARLKRLIDVGLDYLRLGQPANTLSGGEAQRLKLAAYMSATRRGRSLFILDEPTTGLHFQDVVQLVDCFEALVNVGHSLIVVEHNLQLMKAADYIVDLGPGAADEGWPGRRPGHARDDLPARRNRSPAAFCPRLWPQTKSAPAGRRCRLAIRNEMPCRVNATRWPARSTPGWKSSLAKLPIPSLASMPAFARLSPLPAEI